MLPDHCRYFGCALKIHPHTGGIRHPNSGRNQRRGYLPRLCAA